VLGKLFCLYLVMMLFVITITLYALLSGMDIKTLDIWRELNLAFPCFLCFAAMYRVCNYSHNFTNIVRYHKTLYEHIYGALLLYYCLECESRSFEKIKPLGTKNKCSIPADRQSPNTV